MYSLPIMRVVRVPMPLFKSVTSYDSYQMYLAAQTHPRHVTASKRKSIYIYIYVCLCAV
jgi:hypothetical protein